MVSVVLLKLTHGVTQHTAHCNKVRADVTVAGRAAVCAPIVHEAFAIICRTLGKHNLACTYFQKATTFATKLKSLFAMPNVGNFLYRMKILVTFTCHITMLLLSLVQTRHSPARWGEVCRSGSNPVYLQQSCHSNR